MPFDIKRKEVRKVEYPIRGAECIIVWNFDKKRIEEVIEQKNNGSLEKVFDAKDARDTGKKKAKRLENKKGVK